MKEIKAEELNDSFVIVDVLSDKSYAIEHIPNAVNLCIYELAFDEKVIEEIGDKDTKVVLYGYSDRTEETKRAYNRILSIGYTDVSILQGGLEEWKNKGKATVKEEYFDFSDKKYILSSTMSRCEWTGRNIGNKHNGTIDITGGSLKIENNIATYLDVEIDMTSIKDLDIDDDTMRGYLQEHLKSPDFFNVEEFPSSFFQSNKIEIINDHASKPNYKITGSLEIKGIENEITFFASVNPKEKEISLNAHLDIDRSIWDVKYGSERFFANLGIHLIDDYVSFDIIAFFN